MNSWRSCLAEDTSKLSCSFCGKHRDQVESLIAGETAYICDECINLSLKVLKDTNQKAAPVNHTITPREIKDYLDRYIVGQEQAKRALSVAVRNHYKRLDQSDTKLIKKSNVLLIGPSGSGKTLLAKKLAELINVPFAMADATTLTESGYVGDDVENVIHRLLQAADNDIKQAEMGIVYIDEIDKKGRKSESSSITRDVSGEGVQQALLKLIEGTECRVPVGGGRKHPGHEMLTVDTTNILFILGGAFVGLEEQVKKRMTTGTKIGFSASVDRANEDTDHWLSNVEPDDFVKFGMIPEFMGRIPVITALETLTKDDLVRILVEPEDSLEREYQAVFHMDGVEITFTDEARHWIAEQAVKKNTGARGLRAIVEDLLRDLQFDLPDLQREGLTGVVIKPGEQDNLVLLYRNSAVANK